MATEFTKHTHTQTWKSDNQIYINQKCNIKYYVSYNSKILLLQCLSLIKRLRLRIHISDTSINHHRYFTKSQSESINCHVKIEKTNIFDKKKLYHGIALNLLFILGCTPNPVWNCCMKSTNHQLLVGNFCMPQLFSTVHSLKGQGRAYTRVFEPWANIIRTSKPPSTSSIVCILLQ